MIYPSISETAPAVGFMDYIPIIILTAKFSADGETITTSKTLAVIFAMLAGNQVLMIKSIN